MNVLRVLILTILLSNATTVRAQDQKMFKGDRAEFNGVLLHYDDYREVVSDQEYMRDLQWSYDQLEQKYKDKPNGDSFREDLLQILSGFLVGSALMLVIDR